MESDDEFEEATRRHQETMAALLRKRQVQEAEVKARRAAAASLKDTEEDIISSKRAADIASSEMERNISKKKAEDDEHQQRLRDAEEEKERVRRITTAAEWEDRDRQNEKDERDRRNREREERGRQVERDLLEKRLRDEKEDRERHEAAVRMATEERMRLQMREDEERARRQEEERRLTAEREAAERERQLKQLRREEEAAERLDQSKRVLEDENEPSARSYISKSELSARRELLNSEAETRFELQEELLDAKRRQDQRKAFELKQQQRDAEERSRLRQLESESAEKRRVLQEAHRQQLLVHLEADKGLLEAEEVSARELHFRQQVQHWESLTASIHRKIDRHTSQHSLLEALQDTVRTLEQTILDDRRSTRDAFHIKDTRINELEQELAHMRSGIEAISDDVQGSTELHTFLKAKAVDVATREAMVIELERDLGELSVVLQQEFVTVKSLTRRLRLLVADTNCQVVSCVSAAREELQKRQRLHARELTMSLNTAMSAAAAATVSNNNRTFNSHAYDANYYANSDDIADRGGMRGVMANVNRMMTTNSDESRRPTTGTITSGNNRRSSSSSSRLGGQFQVVLTEDIEGLYAAHDEEVRACTDLVNAHREALHLFVSPHHPNSHNNGSGASQHSSLSLPSSSSASTGCSRLSDEAWSQLVAVYHQCLPGGGRGWGGEGSSKPQGGGGFNASNSHLNDFSSPPSSSMATSPPAMSSPTPPLLILLPSLVVALCYWLGYILHEHTTTILLANIDSCIRALRAVSLVLFIVGVSLTGYGMVVL